MKPRAAEPKLSPCAPVSGGYPIIDECQFRQDCGVGSYSAPFPLESSRSKVDYSKPSAKSARAILWDLFARVAMYAQHCTQQVPRKISTPGTVTGETAADRIADEMKRIGLRPGDSDRVPGRISDFTWVES
jgi:hypothetical protein